MAYKIKKHSTETHTIHTEVATNRILLEKYQVGNNLISGERYCIGRESPQRRIMHVGIVSCDSFVLLEILCTSWNTYIFINS